VGLRGPTRGVGITMHGGLKKRGERKKTREKTKALNFQTSTTKNVERGGKKKERLKEGLIANQGQESLVRPNEDGWPTTH